jgi:hypothetical protein
LPLLPPFTDRINNKDLFREKYAAGRKGKKRKKCEENAKKMRRICEEYAKKDRRRNKKRKEKKKDKNAQIKRNSRAQFIRN